jgi:hypothetical protein
MTDEFTTRLLSPETWDDFCALVEANNGVWGGCWCMGFHPGGFAEDAEGNRAAKRSLVERAAVHQVLVYDEDGGCVGWCQFGSPEELPRIKNAALDEIRAAGGGVVEAYPEQTVDRKPQRGAYLHTGPEELYEGFGFVRDRRIAKWRWVMRAEV